MLFQFTALADDSIRLIRFLPYSTPQNIYITFEHQPRYFDDNVEYTTISYDESNGGSKKPITLNGRAFLISSELFEALVAILLHHRISELERFWVYELCVNHRDLAEKNIQVQQRAMIIGSSVRIMSWIGSETEHTALVFRRIKEGKLTDRNKAPTPSDLSSEQIHQPGQITSTNCDPEPTLCQMEEAGRIETNRILGHRYFQRIWTRSEMSRSEKAFIICGSHQCSFIDLQRYAISHDLLRLLDTRLSISVFNDHIESSNASPKPSTTFAEIFSSLVCSYAKLLCPDPRDRIFALLSDLEMRLLPGRALMKVNYVLDTSQVAQQCIQYYDHLETVSEKRGQYSDRDHFLACLSEALELNQSSSSL